ncbi:hypothetical protein CPB97_007185 [Podila verticillata]|nr:hypothetical protein CPB97_007185 [Podila verticillata]
MEPAPSSTTPQPVPSSGSPTPNAVPLGSIPANVVGSAVTAEPLQMEDVVSTNAVTAEAIARQNQTVVEEFQYLLEKSQQLFAGLRDLPPTGAKQWQSYFQKTFEVFAKLWRFQQLNRFVLENSYGLKRWEVGEIASKIGQLYYHYYLRTSDSGYLQDSYIFYDAIRERRYFNEISEIKSSALMIKKLRYYARFTVVCLLLNNRDIMASLKEELKDLVNEYITVYRPPDASDWQLVLEEVTSFTNAEKKLYPVTQTGSFLPVARRLQTSKAISAALDKDTSTTKLKLQEAILVGNSHNQIKFSELTIDMFRILQSLERETPQIRGSSVDVGAKSSLTSAVSAAVTSGTEASSTPAVKEETMDEPLGGQRRNTDKEKKKPNPHKYLLYRPTLSQLMVYLATAFKEVASDSALLIYLSADGSKRSAQDASGVKGYHGGILTNSRKDNSDPEQQSISHCLHPGDLLPFTRKPMFLIVDSNNSVAFADMPRVFNHPFMSLLSPAEYPASIPDTTQVGGLFTLFLHAPLLAFSFISGISQISPDTWEQCSGLISQAESKIAELMASAPLDKPLRRFLQDEFLRQFMIRFALCHIILKAHVSFNESKHLPTSFPSLPASVLESTEVLSKIRSLAILANATCFEFEEPIVVS